MTNLGYFMAAYILVWVGVFVYLLELQRNQNRLKKELESLKKMMGEGKDADEKEKV